MKRSRVSALLGITLLAAACGSKAGTSQNPDGSTTGKVGIGGAVSGLLGTGLVLQDNGGDDLAVSASGPFAFATKLDTGSAYAVTVKQQPRTPSQTCTVAAGAGTAAADVTTVAVTCATNQYTVGGSVSGLLGSGLVLQDNAGDDLAVSADGKFTFAAKVASGQTFTVTIKAQPSSPAQTCTVMGGSGTMGGGDVSSVAINCATDRFMIGGSVSGLLGTGLLLQNNGGDDLAVTADGTFAFATTIASGETFAVTVKTQPRGPAQTCSVSAGSGTVAASNVATVVVHCSTESLAVGGTVTGLAGAGLVLQNNAGHNLPVAADGTFTFAAPVASGATYAVTVLSQPSAPSQTCTVANGSGTVVATAITDVAVTCTTNTYKVGGTVNGLLGSGLTLRDNGGDDLAVAVDGTFTFATKVASGASFAVTLAAQPTGPWQTCTVSGGTGSVGGSDVLSVMVDCTSNGYTVGGTVTGLAGGGLALSLNGGTPLPISGPGTFAFPVTVTSGNSYAVTITGQPTMPWQTCAVTGGSGAVGGADVTSVQVDCTTNQYTVGGAVTGVVGAGLVLRDNGGDDLPVAADGSFTFATKVASGAAYGVTIAAQPTNPWQTCTVIGGAGVMAGANVTTVAVACTINTYAVGGTVSGLAGTGLVLKNNGGDALALTASGTFAFTTKLASGASYAVTVASQPLSPSQTCTITSGGTGTIAGGDIANVTVACVTNRYSVGGTVTGLAGSGLTLRNNTEDLPVAQNGSFTFPTTIASGAAYAVSVSAQPSGPTQTCQVSGGSGTVGGGAVTSVTVNCTTNTYTVGGAVTGLGSATGLVLQNNAGDDLPISGTSFAFATPVPSGAGYAVTVKTQPTSPWETCTVSGGTGTVTSANITSVSVSCAPNNYNLKVAVSGLAGSGLVLQNNGAGNLSVPANGTWTFAATVASGSMYNVTPLAQPTNLWQTCTVASPVGVVGGGDVTLAATCTTNTYSVGGTLGGLTAPGLVLQDNGGNDLAPSGNGPFTFTNRVASGSSYAVTVKTQPSNQWCTVSNGNGTIAGANITSVTVSCLAGMCGRFTTGAPAGWTLGAVIPGNPAFSDITPMGGNTIYNITGTNLFAYSITGAAWTTVSTTAPASFPQWTGPAWVGSNLYFIYNGAAYRYAIPTASWSIVAGGLPGTSFNDNTHDPAGNVYTIENTGRVVKLNTTTNAWTLITPSVSIGGLNEPHVAYDSCSGLLYLVPQYLGQALYSMDPNTGATVALPLIPSGQISDGFCADNSGHLYAAGTASGQQFLQYNIASHTWVPLPTPPQTVGNCGACSVGDDGFLYFAGGCGSPNQLMKIKVQ